MKIRSEYSITKKAMFTMELELKKIERENSEYGIIVKDPKHTQNDCGKYWDIYLNTNSDYAPFLFSINRKGEKQ